MLARSLRPMNSIPSVSHSKHHFPGFGNLVFVQTGVGNEDLVYVQTGRSWVETRDTTWLRSCVSREHSLQYWLTEGSETTPANEMKTSKALQLMMHYQKDCSAIYKIC